MVLVRPRARDVQARLVFSSIGSRAHHSAIHRGLQKISSNHALQDDTPRRKPGALHIGKAIIVQITRGHVDCGCNTIDHCEVEGR